MIYLKRSFSIIKVGPSKTISENLNRLELTYRFQTLHVDYYNSQVQFRKRGNSIIFTIRSILPLKLYDLNCDFLYVQADARATSILELCNRRSKESRKLALNQTYIPTKIKQPKTIQRPSYKKLNHLVSSYLSYRQKTFLLCGPPLEAYRRN